MDRVSVSRLIRPILLMFVLQAPAILSACSVGMAVSGEREPDLTVVKVGATRSEIEAELGRPRSVATTEDGGTRAAYEYEVGNEPSAGRAALHAGMDVLTLGIWELIGTPTEAMQGQRFELTVVYTDEGKVRSVQPRPLN